MDCYDTTDCSGNCDGCEFYEEMVERERRKRQVAAARMVLACLIGCGLIIWLAAHFPGAVR